MSNGAIATNCHHCVGTKVSEFPISLALVLTPFLVCMLTLHLSL